MVESLLSLTTRLVLFTQTTRINSPFTSSHDTQWASSYDTQWASSHDTQWASSHDTQWTSSHDTQWASSRTGCSGHLQITGKQCMRCRLMNEEDLSPWSPITTISIAIGPVVLTRMVRRTNQYRITQSPHVNAVNQIAWTSWYNLTTLSLTPMS